MDPRQKYFYDILRIRAIETEISIRYAEQEMRCPVHLSVGQEAAAVGVCSVLTNEDYMVSSHRGHAHYLAKGGSLRAFLSELYGKQAGCAKGQGGSMHLVDLACGFIASTSIVGGTIPVGVGTAFASWLRKEPRVTVVCIGDAGVEEGVFHESANFASLHRLPVLFSCENNFYSCYTHLKDRQPDRSLVTLAKGHALHTLVLDGNDVFSIHDELLPVIEEMRKGLGPVFVEMRTYRTLEHCGPNNDDNLKYRDEKEIEYFKEHDAIEMARKKLNDLNLWTSELESDWLSAIQNEVMEAFQFAKEAPYPQPDQLGAYIYAE